MVTCLAFTECQHDSGVHQQVLDRIAQAEAMLEEPDIDSCIILLLQTYDFAKDKDYRWGMAEACLDIARCHFMADNVDSALAMLDKGMTV